MVSPSNPLCLIIIVNMSKSTVNNLASGDLGKVEAKYCDKLLLLFTHDHLFGL